MHFISFYFFSPLFLPIFSFLFSSYQYFLFFPSTNSQPNRWDARFLASIEASISQNFLDKYWVLLYLFLCIFQRFYFLHLCCLDFMFNQNLGSYCSLFLGFLRLLELSSFPFLNFLVSYCISGILDSVQD